MDTLSHGLYGGIAFGRTSKIRYGIAFLFGIMPDMLSFGILFALTILGFVSGPEFASGPPPMSSIPEYVHHLYNITHSFFVAGAVIALVWWWHEAPLMEMFAWPLHILVDIPTHSTKFFATPFLWPVSDFKIDGVSWSHPYIFIPNVIFLLGLHLWFYFKRRGRQRSV